VVAASAAKPEFLDILDKNSWRCPSGKIRPTYKLTKTPSTTSKIYLKRTKLHFNVTEGMGHFLKFDMYSTGRGIVRSGSSARNPARENARWPAALAASPVM